jgi:hypothetical protein
MSSITGSMSWPTDLLRKSTRKRLLMPILGCERAFARRSMKTTMNIEYWQSRFLEDPVSADDAFLMECLWQKETGLPMRVWSSDLPTFAVPILRVQTSHDDKSELGQCVGISISRGNPLVICKTILIKTEVGRHLAGKSNVPVPLNSPLHRDDWLTQDDLGLVSLFIQRNLAALLDHWQGISSTSQLLRELKRV